MRNVFKYFKLELIPEEGVYYAPYIPLTTETLSNLQLTAENGPNIPVYTVREEWLKRFLEG